MNSSHNPFGIEGTRSGIMTPDFVSLDRRDRREMLTKSAGIVKFNPQESVVAPHSNPAIKGKVTRSSNNQAWGNPNSINGCPGSIPIVCSRRRGRGMLR